MSRRRPAQGCGPVRRPPLFGKGARRPGVDAHEPLLASIRAGKIDFHGLGRGHYPGDRLATGELPGLLSLGYWDARGDQDWGMDFHRNEGVEICLLETGAMRFAVDHRSFPLGPGDLTITRPWQAHRQGDPRIAAGRLHWATLAVGALRPDQSWHWPRWVLLAPADRAELARRLRQTETAVWQASPEVLQSFRRLRAAVVEEQGDRRQSRVAIGLNELLLGVLDLLRAENRAEQPRLASPAHSVELFLDDLRCNLNSLAREWTLAGMAAACGMGTTQFSQLCRRLTNDSPLRYLNLVRLEAAGRWLRREPGRSVTDIAYACGFASSQYFASQFRQHFGKTPSEYRRVSEGEGG
ncbi:MAG: AraC family transcriptional regulator [Verrucomicrobia bacterium]|nr:AraC family transcriptional regulator [Verrucomicrobiota bacterium]